MVHHKRALVGRRTSVQVELHKMAPVARRKRVKAVPHKLQGVQVEAELRSY